MGKACSSYVAKMNTYRMLMGKIDRKRPLRRPRNSWLNNVELVLGGLM
jgi:hypothetical protein